MLGIIKIFFGYFAFNMKPVFKRVLVVVLLFAVAMTLRYFYLVNKNEALPIINPADIKSKEFISDSLAQIKSNHIIRDFQLINQNGDTITQLVFKNKIYIANFFFELFRCELPIPCWGRV